MDGRRFDEIAKAAACPSRRAFLGSLLAGLTAWRQRGSGAGSIAAQEGCGLFERPCGGWCVDVYSDPYNCGACGTVCPPGSSCNAGRCGCGLFEELCPHGCVDLYSDPFNCGFCGTVCPPRSTCVAGSCQEPSPSRTPAAPGNGPVGNDAPWGVDTVREACWTGERLESALPREFVGITLEPAPGDQEGLYEFSLRRRSYFYVEGADFGDRVIAVHVDSLPDRMSVAEALAANSASMERNDQVDRTDTSPDTAVPYVAYRTWGRGRGDIYALAWGGRRQRVLLTVYVSVQADLAEFLPLVSDNIVRADPAVCDATVDRGTPVATPAG